MSLKVKHKSKKQRLRSDTDSGSEHELFYYANDRVRLMKEVLKVLKLKKIKALAPDGIKSMDIEEMNTLLLEELLGISNKRLKKIFDGCNADDESSSSDEDKAIDVISLDSISDDDICFIDEKKNDSVSTAIRRRSKKHKREKVKKEEGDENAANVDNKILDNKNLLSVLELLELQARARAIRSQLALEAEHRAKEEEEHGKCTQDLNDDDDDDDIPVVVELPAENEIVISSSDSEADVAKSEETIAENKKIKLLENVIVEAKCVSDIPLPSQEQQMSDETNAEQNSNARTSVDDDVIHLDAVEIDDIDA